MKDHRKQEIEKLIQEYLEGILDEFGCNSLLNWLNEDQKNELYFQKYRTTWNPKKEGQLEKSWTTLKAKRQLRENINDYQLNSDRTWGSKTLNITRNQLIKIVAILVVGLIFSFILNDRISDFKKLSIDSQWVQAETVAGQKARIILPDSSVVWLNSETTISFPSDFNSLRNRIVKLQGEAYFDVKNQGNSRFVVQCPDYNVEVKGTEFNVMAYKDFNRTETTLVEGVVTIKKGKQSIQLKPGERIVYSNNYLVKSKGQVRQAAMWKENRFYFDNVPFKELARRLERWYDVKITLNDQSLNDVYYSGYFKNEETVWQVLDVIKITTPIEYERKEFREITIDKRIN